MGILALSAQSVVEALAGAALQPWLRRLGISVETTQSGLEPCQTEHVIFSLQQSTIGGANINGIPYKHGVISEREDALINRKHGFTQTPAWLYLATNTEVGDTDKFQ